MISEDETCGVPQGSVLGPAFWTTLYDDLLDVEVPAGVKLVAFADDFRHRENRRAGWRTAEPCHRQSIRLDERQRAPGKSAAVVLTQKEKYKEPQLILEGHRIPVNTSIRYLAVILDTRLSFTEHVTAVSRKAMEAARAIW